jgi:putative ATPase
MARTRDMFDWETGSQDAAPAAPSSARPLADRMRPRTLEEFLGQEDLVGKGSLLRRMIESDEVRSVIFWGPPGSGKTTLAGIIARMTEAHFLSLSAAVSGLADIKRAIAEAREVHRSRPRRVILFIDEIHRFNRVQQDALLPHVEAGLIVLIGATTENPSFSIISPLLSRCRVFTLSELTIEHLMAILETALHDSERGFGEMRIAVEEGVLGLIARMSDGDARRALNLFEMVVCSSPLDEDGGYTIAIEKIKEVAQRKQLVYDASGEHHYNLISAFHKSLRGSDPHAAVYWLVRMLTAGEDPLFVLRRMMVFAAEDVGNADPRALQVAVAAFQAFQHLGQPEGEIPMTQAVVYLATAPKSNSSYKALNAARAEVNRTGSLPVPLVIRNAPTKLMKDLGYGDGYQYDHDYADHFAPQECLPEEIAGAVFFKPGEFGFERDIARRMEWWDARRREAKRQEDAPSSAAAAATPAEPRVGACRRTRPARPRASKRPPSRGARKRARSKRNR